MSARKVPTGDAAGTIVLVCDGCPAEFTAGKFGAGRTRLIAEVRHGWKVASFADRTDYCRTCKEDLENHVHEFLPGKYVEVCGCGAYGAPDPDDMPEDD